MQPSPDTTKMAHSPMAALDKLPEELLLQICRHILGDITQLIKDEPNNTRSAYVARVQGLVNLAKTSKVFVPAAQEVLYQSAILGDITQVSDTDSAMYNADRSPVIALVRTLIARPDLQRHLQVLQLIVPGPYAYKYYDRRDRGDTPLPHLHYASQILPASMQSSTKRLSIMTSPASCSCSSRNCSICPSPRSGLTKHPTPSVNASALTSSMISLYQFALATCHLLQA
jgi:hypothetical protein